MGGVSSLIPINIDLQTGPLSVCVLNSFLVEIDAIQIMEVSEGCLVYKSGSQAKRLNRLNQAKQRELDFCRRLSGVVCKPPYAALSGNVFFVVSDKEKRGQ